LEDIHGAVHVWVGGEMGRIDWAAYDPIFWAHHANIDRLWARWQLTHSPIFPRSYLDRALPPFPMTVRQTLDVSGLGYDYASSATAGATARRATATPSGAGTTRSTFVSRTRSSRR